MMRRRRGAFNYLLVPSHLIAVFLGVLIRDGNLGELSPKFQVVVGTLLLTITVVAILSIGAWLSLIFQKAGSAAVLEAVGLNDAMDLQKLKAFTALARQQQNTPANVVDLLGEPSPDWLPQPSTLEG